MYALCADISINKKPGGVSPGYTAYIGKPAANVPAPTANAVNTLLFRLDLVVAVAVVSSTVVVLLASTAVGASSGTYSVGTIAAVDGTTGAVELSELVVPSEELLDGVTRFLQ